MEDKEIIDQSQLAQDVAEKIKYDFYEFFLVKPLDPIKVKKEVSKPVAKGSPKTDKDGIEAQDFDEVETEVVEVNSDYRKGVVIKTPLFYKMEDTKDKALVKANPGDIVLFREAAGLRFDLVKDSRLLRMYDIIGIENQK
jgi:hypothetical protein